MKIGDTVHVETDLGVPMPFKLVIVGTHPVLGETWFTLEDPEMGFQYAHFAPHELTLLEESKEEPPAE